MAWPNTVMQNLQSYHDSGNDFVRNFTHKENFMNIQNLVDGEIEYLDVVKYNDSFCMNMLNVGTDCDINICSTELRAQGKYKGAMSYAVAALKILPKSQTYDLEYTDAEGVAHRENVLLACVGNGKFCGGGFKPCPSAKLTDGLMDLVIVRPLKGLKLMNMLLKYRQGTHIKGKDTQQYIEYIQASELKITPYQDVFMCVDGETEKFVETSFKVIPKAIKFVIPKGSKLIDR